ncbi:hypothetical protein N9137_00815 [Pseudomonadales bacterium]|nr:hypothetical protein [Pseudomonadales bacterium]
MKNCPVCDKELGGQKGFSDNETGYYDYSDKCDCGFYENADICGSMRIIIGVKEFLWHYKDARSQNEVIADSMIYAKDKNKIMKDIHDVLNSNNDETMQDDHEYF